MIGSERIEVTSPYAPAAIGPYSQAMKVGNLIFCSGQIPIDPQSGQVVGTDVASQTDRVLRNLTGVLEATASGLFQVVKTTVFLKSMEDFAAMNAVYAKFFPISPPARSTVEVARLPKDVLVEIDCIAYQPPVEAQNTSRF